MRSEICLLSSHTSLISSSGAGQLSLWSQGSFTFLMHLVKWHRHRLDGCPGPNRIDHSVHCTQAAYWPYLLQRPPWVPAQLPANATVDVKYQNWFNLKAKGEPLLLFIWDWKFICYHLIHNHILTHMLSQINFIATIFVAYLQAVHMLALDYWVACLWCL